MEKIGDILVRVDWEYGGEKFPESTTLEKLPLMLASIAEQGGSVIGVRPLEVPVLHLDTHHSEGRTSLAHDPTDTRSLPEGREAARG